MDGRNESGIATQPEGASPLFSLVSGDGDGFMLGLAAGDTAGGAWELGYSAITEQATVVAYQLIEHRALDRDRLVHAMRELDGSLGDEPVFRSESPAFRAWLDGAAAGAPVPAEDSSAENLVRCAPIGAAFQRDADAVVDHSINLSRMYSTDAGSITTGVIGASAVAAAAFGQSGRDFVTGVSEAVIGAVSGIGDDTTGYARVETLEQELLDSMEHVGMVRTGAQALEAVGGSAQDPLSLSIAGLLLAAPVSDRSHTAVEEAARIGGSILGAFVGAVVGARVGIRAWPWPFANDTWFAEIGRRVVRGPDEVRDLPIPYAVEQHLMTGARHGFH